MFSELHDLKKEENVSSNPALFLRLNLSHVTLPMAAADCSIQPLLILLPTHHPPRALSHLPASSSSTRFRLRCWILFTVLFFSQCWHGVAILGAAFACYDILISNQCCISCGGTRGLATPNNSPLHYHANAKPLKYHSNGFISPQIYIQSILSFSSFASLPMDSN